MEPLLMILVPGLLGGLALALLIAGARTGTPSIVVPKRLAAPSPSLINMAHIPVEGGGGLGLVAAVIAVALADPRIRVAIGIAALLGVALASVLIALRRDRGPLTSGDDRGTPSVLGLGRDGQPGRAPARANDPPRDVPPSQAGANGYRLAVGH